MRTMLVAVWLAWSASGAFGQAVQAAPSGETDSAAPALTTPSKALPQTTEAAATGVADERFDPFEGSERPHLGPIPEPGTLLLLTAGLITLIYRNPSRRRRHALA